MSRSMTLLKAAEEQRASKYTVALNKTPTNTSNPKKATWPIALSIPIAFLFLLLLNITLFIAIHKNFSKTDYLFTKNASQITAINFFLKGMKQEFKQINKQIDDASKNISQLEKLNSVNRQAIDNLTEAKNILFNKTSSLEVELNKLKPININ